MAIASRSATLRAAARTESGPALPGRTGRGGASDAGRSCSWSALYGAPRHILSSCPATVPGVEFDNISGRQLIAEPASRAGPGAIVLQPRVALAPRCHAVLNGMLR